MRIQFNLYFLLLLLMILVSCNDPTKPDADPEEITSITEAPDSVEKCDSIIKKIIKEEGEDEEIPFPDTIPHDIYTAIEILEATTTRQTKIWMRCISKGVFLSRQHLNFGMYLRNKWLLWHGSELAEFFYKHEIGHPDDMSHFILSGFYDAVKGNEFNFEEDIRDFHDHIKEMEKYERQTITNNRRFVDSIHNIIDYERIIKRIKGINHDSINLHVEQFNGDTLRYWTSGGTGRCTREEFIELAHDPKYGKKYFFNGIDDNSTDVWISTLRLTKFLRRNDTLYLYDEGKYVNILIPAMFEDMDLEIEWQREKECTMNRSFINRHWKLDGRNYYLLDIKGDCKGTGLHVRYFVDEDLKVVFDNHIINKLWGMEIAFLNKYDSNKL